MTADLATLRALKKRCEKATKPDRELDADLFQNFGGDLWMEARKRAAEPCGAPEDLIVQGARWRSPFFTASIDAALALVERLGEEPERILDNAMEDITKYGWRGSKWLPMLPIFIIYSLLSALISRAEEARQP